MTSTKQIKWIAKPVTSGGWQIVMQDETGEIRTGALLFNSAAAAYKWMNRTLPSNFPGTLDERTLNFEWKFGVRAKAGA